MKGTRIEGIDAAAAWRDGVVFHAGTAAAGGAVVTNGGRVLTACALGDDLTAAVRHAYEGVATVRFAGMHYRHDIGHRALERR